MLPSAAGTTTSPSMIADLAAIDVPSIVGDFLEAVGPAVAAAGKNFYRFIGEMNLHAVAVELDLVDPAFAGVVILPAPFVGSAGWELGARIVQRVQRRVCGRLPPAVRIAL
jgi:hypothetical protein